MAPKESSPTVSICICSRGHANRLRDLIGQLKNIETSNSVEIIAVEETHNAAPIDGTVYVAHPIMNRGIPYARNLAIKHARTSIIVFLDDDCSISKGWLDCLLEPLQKNGIVGVQGGVRVPTDSNAIGWAESILGFPGGGISRILRAKGRNQVTKEISTLNCAYYKWVIDKIGGFNEKLVLGAEDFLLAKQASLLGICFFVPSALIFHEPRGSVSKIWSWFVRRGRAEIALIKSRELKEVSLKSIIPRTLALKFVLLMVIGITFPTFFFPIAILGGLFYLLLQYGRHLDLWRASKAPISAMIVLPLVKFVMDIAMDWGRFRGLLFD